MIQHNIYAKTVPYVLSETGQLIRNERISAYEILKDLKDGEYNGAAKPEKNKLILMVKKIHICIPHIGWTNV